MMGRITNAVWKPHVLHLMVRRIAPHQLWWPAETLRWHRVGQSGPLCLLLVIAVVMPCAYLVVDFELSEVEPLSITTSFAVSLALLWQAGIFTIASIVRIFLLGDAILQSIVIFLMPPQSLAQWVAFMTTPWAGGLSRVVVTGSWAGTGVGAVAGMLQHSDGSMLLPTAVLVVGYGFMVPHAIASRLGPTAAAIAFGLGTRWCIAGSVALSFAAVTIGLHVCLLPRRVTKQGASDTRQQQPVESSSGCERRPCSPPPVITAQGTPVFDLLEDRPLQQVPGLANAATIAHVTDLEHARASSDEGDLSEEHEHDSGVWSSTSPSHSSVGDAEFLAEHEATVFGDV